MSVLTQYEHLRKKLIDTGLRNRMLNYTLSRASGVAIEGEDPDQVFQMLVIAEGIKKMVFTGQPDGDKQSGLSLDEDLEGEVLIQDQFEREATKADQSDNKLNTPHKSKILERRLLKTFRDAQELYEETGINVLYLVLGNLRWNQADDASKFYIAPLVFVPVNLERDNGGRFGVRFSGEDLGDNISLRVKLKDEYGIELPEFVEGQTIAEYAQTVALSCQSMPGWSVDTSFLALGFFQFTKLVMYEDLRADLWTDQLNPVKDEDLVAILGDGYSSSESNFSENLHIDEVRTPEECKEIYSCDSSQALAMLRALEGRSMVIEGPPGTGKSQTIANLIAEYVAQGKKVLFVSEKMAALDVVFRRLDAAALSDACLELHNRASRRKSFYDELKRVMSLRGQLAPAESEINRLTNLRSRLNGYAKAVNDAIDPWGLTPHEAIGLASTLPVEEPEDIAYRISFEAVRTFAYGQLKEKFPVITSYQSLLQSVGLPSRHPFAGCDIRVVTPGLNLELRADLEKAEELLTSATEATESLCRLLCLDPLARPSDMAVVSSCVERAIDAPTYDGVAIKLESWRSEMPVVTDCIAQLRQLQEIKSRRSNQVQASIWTADLETIIRVLDQWVPKWHKFISGEYKVRLRELHAHLAGGSSVLPMDALLIAKDVAATQVATRKIESHASTMSRLFGVQWQGVNSQPDILQRLSDWCLELRGAVEEGAVPQGLLDFFSANHSSQDLRRQARDADELLKQAMDRCKSIASKLVSNVIVFDEQTLAETHLIISKWRTNLSRLSEITQLNILEEEMRRQGLEPLLQIASDWTEAPAKLRIALERAYYEGVLKTAVGQREPLQGFDRFQHEELIKEFSQAEDFLLRYNQARVKHAHLRGLPDWSIAGGNTNLLKKQCELRRGHKPIRWALEKAGALIQQMKPVFLMSPLSVAQFLPRESVRFDVVIFDEASQIKPEDALSAIVRADQTVVVGDSKQMPPTAFFDKLVSDLDDEDDEVQAVGSMESLLALMAATVRGTSRSTDLRWHYRSLHPSLIRPSNSEFYENRLVVFPSPVLQGSEGLKLHYDGSDIYDRGGSRKNVKQAERIAQAVIHHMQECPRESLIAVAFSKQQEEAIQDAVELELRSNSGLLSEHNSRHPFEPFRVKNLESVQGDERDVVFISVGYGPDANGFTSMSFGPINSSGGDRRLNVLMSRARKRCEVFSSIRSSDFRLSELSQPGPVLLKKFLQFAETGDFDDPRPSGREEDSVFEEQVARALRQRGVEVDVQVGSIGFYIDLAVRHPEYPGRYVLGIECDGAAYHSARSARDRDKLRQAALEARGWTLHRIWSTDWWQNQDYEVERCLAAIQLAIDNFDKELHAEEERIDAESETVSAYIIEVPPVVASPGTVPYQMWTRQFNLQGYSIQNLPPEAMAKCVHTILTFEGPLHESALIARIRKSADLGRAGTLVRTAVLQGMEVARRQGLIESRSDYHYPKGWICTAMRDVSHLASSDKRPEYVAPEEFVFGLSLVVKSSYGISADDAISRVWRMIGFSQVTKNMIDIGAKCLTKAVNDGCIWRESSGELHLPK